MSAPKLPEELPVLLLAWFARAARKLPWRRDRDPYRVWLSEIMLQQTRVAAVTGFFERFTVELPTVEALAAAPEEQLMRLWAGLGYYRRMRLLQQCARQVVGEYGGRFPERVAELAALPGIGAYTAGAISSIAFGHPEPAVDGNVLRVLSRLAADNSWNADSAARALAPLYPAGRCSEFTQSLMELGALICLPGGTPHCDRCPVQRLCRAFACGVVDRFPLKRKKPERPVEHLRVFILRNDGCIALRRRPAKGLLAGLFELPNWPERSAPAPESFGRVLRHFGARHVFTHREWVMTAYEIAAGTRSADFEWFPEADAVLPSAFRKLVLSRQKI